MSILAIDPGTRESAWIVLDGDRIRRYDSGVPLMGHDRNEAVLEMLRGWHSEARFGDLPFLDAVVIERIEPRYGLRMGWETIGTCEWVGRFAEAARHAVSPASPATLLCRSDILRHLNVPPKANADSGVRMAMLDRWGGESAGRKGGPLYGVRKHIWQAIGAAVAYREGVTEREVP